MVLPVSCALCLEVSPAGRTADAGRTHLTDVSFRPSPNRAAWPRGNRLTWQLLRPGTEGLLGPTHGARPRTGTASWQSAARQNLSSQRGHGPPLEGPCPPERTATSVARDQD